MSSRSLLPQVERLFGEGTVAGLPEAALLERFLARRDEAAFAALVARHGPLVLGVCRRILRDPADIEDAFQATFLVLVRRARSIQRRELLAPWLYGVAFRVATRASKVSSRRRRHESPLNAIEPAAPCAEPTWSDIRPVLDEELGRLPERYRLPLVLFYLQGLTHDETAIRLGCPVGTVRSRLARGRERLARRLTRRGLAPSVALTAASLCSEASAVPAELVTSTSIAAARIAAGCAVPAALSAGSAALLEGACRSMTASVWRKSVVMAAGLCVLVGGLWAKQAPGDPPRRPPVRAPKPDRAPRPGTSRDRTAVTRPAVRPLARYVVQPPDMLIVEVLEALPGRPISGERLVRPDGTISLGFYGDVYVAGLTAPEIKEKVVRHLATYLCDEALGLKAPDASDPTKTVFIAPKDSDSVFVDVAAYNSAAYYAVGDFAAPGRFPITGSDTVLDAINYAGGLLPGAVPPHVRLIRPGQPGKPDEVLSVNYEEISMGTDPSTNYQIMPGDRLVATRDRKGVHKPSEESDADGGDELRRLERRLDRLEEKLDRILDAVGQAPKDTPRRGTTGPGAR